MAAEADHRLLLSPGNKELMSCSAPHRSPVSVLDIDSFEDCKTDTTTSPTTTCSFDISAAVVIPPLETRFAPLGELDPTALKSFDDLVALVGIHGNDAVDKWIASFNDDETVVAELEASFRDDIGLDDETVYTSEVEPATKPADVLAGEPAGKPDSNLPKKKRRTTHSVGARRRGRAREESRGTERSRRGAMRSVATAPGVTGDPRT